MREVDICQEFINLFSGHDEYIGYDQLITSEKDYIILESAMEKKMRDARIEYSQGKITSFALRKLIVSCEGELKSLRREIGRRSHIKPASIAYRKTMNRFLRNNLNFCDRLRIPRVDPAKIYTYETYWKINERIKAYQAKLSAESSRYRKR